ncbi:MAG TPA: PDZ domain-containing protein [Beijerinckia sp.]|jgi:hypothetical protein|nr:PDZ domain-containing protein [Beijerinckia sp.]
MIKSLGMKAPAGVFSFNKIQALLIGLIVLGAPDHPARAENLPKIISSEFDKDIAVLGLHLFDNPLGGSFKEWFLRSIIDKKTGHVTTELYISLQNATNHLTFSSASDDTAKDLVVDQIDHLSDSEELGVLLDQNVLIKHADTGYRIRITSDSGDAIIFVISPEQIKAQIGAITDVLNVLNADVYQGGPHIGIVAVPVGYTQSRRSNLQEGRGMFVAKVEQGSLAEQAGLHNGDLILSVDGVPVNSYGTLNNAMKHIGKKQNVTLIAERNRQ